MKRRSADRRSEQIRRSFSQAARRYDESAGLQSIVASELLDQIISMAAVSRADASLAKGPSHFPAILDIGCGTGFLTAALRQRFPSAAITGADFSHPMLTAASRKAQGQKLRFVTTDGAALSFKDAHFHLVTSSLAYQWLPDLSHAFAEACRVLLPGGAFVFSLLGEGTFRELKASYREAVERGGRASLPPLMEFPPSSRVITALDSAGFHHLHINVVEKKRYYHNLFEFLRTVNKIGAANPSSGAGRDRSLARGALLRKIAGIYHEKYGVRDEASTVPATREGGLTDESIYATYNVLMCRAIKV